MTARASALTLALVTLVVTGVVAAQQAGSTISTGRIFESLSLAEGMTVCEMGAGDGELSIAAAKAVGPGGRVYTSELGDDRIRTLRERVQSSGLSNIAVVAAAVLILIAAFGWLEYRRWKLQSEWSGMATQVTKLNGVQANITEFRPYYDTSFQSLTVMKGITDCFPDNGVIFAKSFEVRGTTKPNIFTVTISGSARDNAAIGRVQDALRKLKEAEAVKIDKLSGKTPIQFTISLRWKINPGA